MRITLNNHLLNIFLIFICISPNFIFLRQDILIEDIKYLLIYYIFFLLLYIVSYQAKKFNNLKNIYLIFLSIIIFYGFDKNLRLWLFFENIVVSLQPEKNIINYIISFIFFVLVSYFIFKILSKDELSLKKAALFSILLLSIFNISSDYYLDTKYKNLEKIIKINTINNQKNNKEKNIIIILDGLVGPGGIDDEIDRDIGAKKSFFDLYKEHDFKVYTNAYSIYYETLESIPSILNFDFQATKDNTANYMYASILDKQSTYFLNKNKFFSQNSKKIFATKNRIFNFCNDEVSGCYSLNHDYPEEKKYVTRLESLLSEARTDERSILFQYFWRFCVFIGFNKEDLFKTNKVFFEKDLNNFERIISNSDFDTYLTFFMYPHSPFMTKKNGENCSFKKLNEILYRGESRKDNLREHYTEIYCGNLIIDKFLDRLKKNNNFNNLNILIVSDTGLKIDRYDTLGGVDGLGTYDKKYLNDAHKVLFAIKKGKSLYDIDETLISSQELFSKYFNKNYTNIKSTSEAIVFDDMKKVFVKFE